MVLEVLHGVQEGGAVERPRRVALDDHDERLAAAELVLHGAMRAVELGVRGQDARRRIRIADLDEGDQEGSEAAHPGRRERARPSDRADR